jgi:GT2 family glycosyltransferase
MVSTIILAYNRSNEVLKTIEKLKLLRQSFPLDLEIIVVDNASIDDTSALVSSCHPDVKLITKTKNNGIAGWNDGFEVARYKYMLVLDDDSHIQQGLTEAVAYLENNEDIGILTLQIASEHPSEVDLLNVEDFWKDGEDVVGFIGCGAIIRRDLFKKIGGYADWIYVYTHEFEYSIRCLDSGYRIVFFGNGIVIHRVSNINRSVERLRIFATRNELAIIYKYFTTDRVKYLIRIILNNLKFAKREGFMSAYYVLLGTFKFFAFKSSLQLTPVSPQTQRYFSERFWSTQSVFKNLKRRFTNKKSMFKQGLANNQ